MHFSAPIIRDTRMGPRLIRSAPINHKAFWKAWNEDKAAWYERGFSVQKTATGWILSQFLNPDGTVTQQAKEMAARAREEAGEGSLPADWVPDDVTLVSEQASKLFEYQKPAALRLKRALMNGNALDASDTGCHAKGTPILMHDGTVKVVEDVQVGDMLMGWDGSPREVLRLARGREQMARIIPTKGEPFIVNVNHILTLVQTNAHQSRPESRHNGRVVDVTVADWLKWGATAKHIHKLFRVPVNSWPMKELPITPYSLGVLLGDGCLTTKASLSISKPGPEMEFRAELLARSNGATIRTGGDTKNPTHHFKGAKDLWRKLEFLGLAGTDSGTKFIPQEYKTACATQRRNLLAGLLDTDGSLTSNGYDYISKSKQLSEDVAFVARSLGLAAYVKECEKGCQTGARGIYWRVSISGDCSRIPLRIPRKRAARREQKKDVLRTGFKVELLPEDDFYGFTITGDGRFLLGDFTVTHNTGKTFAALVVAAELGMTPCVIAPLAVLPSWERAAKFLGVRLGWLINYDKIRGGKSGLGRWKPAKEEDPTTKQRGDVFVFDYLPGEKPLLVFDECHKCKAVDTKQGAILRDAASHGHKILCLSATAAKDPTEMRNLGAALGLHDGSRKAFEAFCLANGCKAGSHGLKFDGKNRRLLERLHRQIFPLKGNRIRVADLPEFPETQILAETLTCNTSFIRAAYDQMETNLARLESETGLNQREKAAASLAEIVKARKAAEEGKLDLFAELAKEAVEEGRSAVIFLNFRDHVKKLSEVLKADCLIWGQQTPEERQANIDAFNADKRRICIVSLQAGGAGLSLHDLNGNHPRVALISPSYSAVDLKQALGRIHRAGAKTKSFQRIIFAASTIEEEVCVSIREKLQNIDSINDGHLAPPSILKHALPEKAQEPALV